MLESNRVPKSLVWTPVRLLMLGEAALFLLAVPLVTVLQPVPEEDGGVRELAQWNLELGIIYAVFMIAVMHALGMHVIRSRRSVLQVTMKYVCGAAVGTAALWIVIHTVAGTTAEPAHVIAVVGLLFLLMLAWRTVVGLVIDSAAVRRSILVLGAGRKAAIFNEALRRQVDRRGLDIIGFLPVGEPVSDGIAPRQLLHARTSLARLCERAGIREIVVAHDENDADIPFNDLLECRFKGIPVTQAATFIERECGRIAIELADPNWWLFRDGLSENWLKRVLKRGFDLFAGSMILVLASPLMLVCAAAIKAGEGLRAPVFYRQERVGRNGETFELVKFRSMREDAEKDGIARWAAANDDRVTRVGSVLRKMRLDELPQLLNVIRGDMSLVGPRPERPAFVRELSREIPYYERRHAVRPGITGWAQLSYPYGASTRDALEKLKFDLYYIKNSNLFMDIAILLRTVEVVLFGKGAR